MKRVLVCDDAEFMRLIIKGMLTKNGFEVVGEARNGEDAIIKYKQLKPDVVTMDITMPEKNGIEALKEILIFDKDARIIMLSAMGQEYLVKDAIINGAKNFIIKPFTEEIMVNALKKISEL